MNLAAYKTVERELLKLSSIQGYMQKQRHPSFYLQRTHEALALLGHPERQFTCIHIGGTAGKGSVTMFLHYMLNAAGKRVGSFISPHVTTPAERTIINTKPALPSDIVWGWKRLRPIIANMKKRGSQHVPSYFEANFLLSLLLFAKHHVEWAVVEVGCGGEFDATNAIPPPKIAILTNVHLDHTQLLGKTRKQIAKTKAGIIKRGSHVITGETDPTIRKIIEKRSREVHARFQFVSPRRTKPDITTASMKWAHPKLGRLSSHLLGTQFLNNAEIAIAAAEHIHISKKAQREGIANMRMPGRTEFIQLQPDVLLDGAHNPAKMRALLSFISKLDYIHIRAVVGIGNAKQQRQMLDLLRPVVTSIVFTSSYTKNPKPTPPKKMQSIWKSLSHKPSRIMTDPLQAIKRVMFTADTNTLVLVTGSLYLVGDVRSYWIPEQHILRTRNLFTT